MTELQVCMEFTKSIWKQQNLPIKKSDINGFDAVYISLYEVYSMLHEPSCRRIIERKLAIFLTCELCIEISFYSIAWRSNICLGSYIHGAKQSKYSTTANRKKFIFTPQQLPPKHCMFHICANQAHVLEISVQGIKPVQE